MSIMVSAGPTNIAPTCPRQASPVANIAANNAHHGSNVDSVMAGARGSRSRRRAHHFIVGMTNSAPSFTPEGQREVTVLVLV
jgi:hypothetical protein